MKEKLLADALMVMFCYLYDFLSYSIASYFNQTLHTQIITMVIVCYLM